LGDKEQIVKPALKGRFFVFRIRCVKEGVSEMKMLLGFFVGMTVCLLLMLTMNHNTPVVSADDSNATTSSSSIDVSGLLPDVDKIYRQALGGPYRQVESEITDPDIARYFRTYMDATGLDKIGAD
jgi:hypothetical protein